jgi:hypothetical protein
MRIAFVEYKPRVLLTTRSPNTLGPYTGIPIDEKHSSNNGLFLKKLKFIKIYKHFPICS